MSSKKIEKKAKKEAKSKAEKLNIPQTDLSSLMEEATLEEGEAGSSSGNPLPDSDEGTKENTTEDSQEKFEDGEIRWTQEIAHRAFQLLMKEEKKLADSKSSFAKAEQNAGRDKLIREKSLESSEAMRTEEMKTLLEAIQQKPSTSRLVTQRQVMTRITADTISALETDMDDMVANGEKVVIRQKMSRPLIAFFTRVVTAETNGWAATEAEWLEWQPEVLIARMRQSLNNVEVEGLGTTSTCVSLMKKQEIGFYMDPVHNQDVLQKLEKILDEHVPLSDQICKKKETLKTVRKEIARMLHLTKFGIGVYEQLISKERTDWSWPSWIQALTNEIQKAQKLGQLAKLYGSTFETVPANKRKRVTGEEEDPKEDPPPPPKKLNQPTGGGKHKNAKPGGGKTNQERNLIPKCKGCGRPGHNAPECLLKDHPDFNKENKPYESSTIGLALWPFLGNQKQKYLPNGKTLDGKGCEKKELPIKVSENDTYIPMCGVCNEDVVHVKNVRRLNALSHEVGKDPHINEDHLTTFTLISTSNNPSDSLRLNVLMDTGAIGTGSNYVSREVGQKLKVMGYNSTPVNERVCSCLVGNCHIITEVYKLRIFKLINAGENPTPVTIHCRVVDIPYDMVIGRQKLQHCPYLRTILLDELAKLTYDNEEESDSNIDSSSENCSSRIQSGTNSSLDHLDETAPDKLEQRSANINIETLDVDPLLPDYIPPSKWGGNQQVTQEAKALCKELHDVFSVDLKSTSAYITPLEIKISEGELWGTRENTQPPRLQSHIKSVEIFKQVLEMVKMKVVRESQAGAHSQVMLTPKQNGTWRFCVDFRRLNSKTKPNHWPLPKIKEMLNRLGAKKPKFFAVIDLTKGYYQAPLAKDSIPLTAFITPNGLYEWLRVPMGLSGAPSYFQRAMTHEVLVGLVYNICEVYLDDIIIHGNTEEEFISNLRKVLERLREFNITVNPNKCQIGLEEVEYVGHVINSEGIKFSPEKLQKVINIDLPENCKGLKSFVGLVNYFRDHVSNHSARVEPLTRLLDNYMPGRAINWDQHPGAVAAFHDIKKAVNECPMLFFYDETMDVHLYTDASLEGVGAYLCQRDTNGKEYPIAFYSKSLPAPAKEWGIPELESFAIYAAFKEFDYLLRDAFTYVHTDHKNLVYIKEGGSAKIMRWKMDLQEYQSKLIHIPGKDNIVGDYWSRNPAAEVETEYISDHNAPNVANMLCGMSITKLELDSDDKEILHELNVMRLNAMTWMNHEIPEERQEDIQTAHCWISGHHGVDHTVEKLVKMGKKWTHMREHVNRFIHECDTCQKSSYRNFKTKVPRFVTGKYLPMERLNIDTIGPFTTDEYGYKYVICIIDCFTRFITLYPVKTLDADEAAEQILKHLGTFGVPGEILTDGGGQYVNDIIRELLELAGTSHIVSIAHSHEENSMIERHNGEIGRWIRDILYDQSIEHGQWTKYLPWAVRLHNSTPVRFMGYTPCKMLLGDRIDLDRNILVPPEARTIGEGEEITEWMSERRVIHDNITRIASDLQKRHEKEHTKGNTDDETDFTVFKAGTYVLQDYPETGFGPRKPSKLYMMHKGPYEVLGNTGNLYRVLNLVTNKEETKGVFLLRPYHYNPKRTDPRTEAMKDQVEIFNVEKILKHTGKFSLKKTLKFLIKWEGYDNEEDLSWEPWANVRESTTMMDYLLSIGHEKHHPDYQKDPLSDEARKSRKRKKKVTEK